MRSAVLISLASLFLFVMGCGGGSGSSNNNGGPGTSQGVSGAYEFAAVSTVTSGQTTLIEASLSANGADTNANGPSQVQTATYVNGLWYVNGGCVQASPGQNTIAGVTNGSNISLTFNEGGNVYTGQGTLNGSTVSGTYSGGGPNCADSGTFTGVSVSALSGTFAGTLAFPTGSDQVTAALTETGTNSLAIQTTLSGTDNGVFTFSGSAVANVAFVSGTVNGNAFSLFGYFDKDGTYTGTPNSIAVWDYDTLLYEGQLVKQ